MVQAATADVVIRSRAKGAKVYRDTQQQLSKLASKMKTFGLISGGVALAGITALTAKSFESADALAKQADRVGTTTEKLKTMQHLAELAGGSSENMSKSMLKASKALGEFNLTGAGTAAPILKQLNLDTKALAQLRPDELFQVYADEIRKLGTRSEQAAASALLFGDRTGEMLNIIDMGPEVFAETEDEVTRYALALNRVDSAKVEAANDAMFKVKERMTGVGNVIASKVAPVITALANRFLDSGAEADVMGNVVDKVMNGIAAGVGLIADALFGWQIIFAAIKVGALEFSTFLVGGLARIEKAVIIIGNKMASVFGGEQIDPESGFLAKVEASLKASSEHAQGVLAGLVAAERPSIGIANALEKAREDAEAAGVATAAAREKLQAIAVPEDDETFGEAAAREKDAAELQRLRDKIAAKIEIIAQGMLTESEREVEAFQSRNEILAEALENELITKERFFELEQSLAEKHEKKLAEIRIKEQTALQKFDAQSSKAKIKGVFAELATISAGTAANNKAMFRLNQVAAIANAIVNTSEGVTKSLAAYPMPLAAVMAAAHLAAGLAQVAAIKSATFGGGTTPSVAGSTPTFQNQPVASAFPSTDAGDGSNVPGSSITIIVEGSLIGDDGIRQVIAETIGELVDADEILIDPTSRQAEEIRSGSGSGG